MKKLSYLLVFNFLFSCTSNTIFEKPKDLIPKDTMSLLIQDLMIASSAKAIKNKNLETKENYLPLIYNKYKIDSTRFKRSNLYYASVIDIYKEILENVKSNLEKQQKFYKNLETKLDSIRKDSIKKAKNKLDDTVLKSV